MHHWHQPLSSVVLLERILFSVRCPSFVITVMPCQLGSGQLPMTDPSSNLSSIGWPCQTVARHSA
jgi:hypothetical protein